MVSGISNSSFNLTAQPIRNRENQKEKSVKFAANNSEYNNPVNKNTEMIVACSGPAILSLALGTGAGLMAKFMTTKVGNKMALGIGAVVTGVSALLTIPGAIYSANVNASMKKEHYNVFEGERKAATNIAREIHQETKDPDKLKSNIDNYFKFRTAEKGNGIGIISSN